MSMFEPLSSNRLRNPCAANTFDPSTVPVTPAGAAPRIMLGDCTARSPPVKDSEPPIETLLDASRYRAPPGAVIDEPGASDSTPAAPVTPLRSTELCTPALTLKNAPSPDNV